MKISYKKRYKENYNNYRTDNLLRGNIKSERTRILKSLPVDLLLQEVGYFN